MPAPPTSAATTTTSGGRPTTTTAPTGRATVLTRGDTARRLVALTFDAGSDAGSTTAILDQLAASGIRATFGVTGVWAQANPGLVQRMAREGHQVVNHTWDHRSFTGASTGTAPLPRSERLAELDRADALIRQLTGTTTRPWFRPPYGDRDSGVDADVGSDGYRYEVMWTVDSLGWKGTPAAAVTARVLAAAVPGAIVLCHVGSESTDAAALPQVISGLQAMGYGFATVAQIV